MDVEDKVQLILTALDERKAQEIQVLDVSALTHMTDRMVICSGTSNVHIRAVADRVLELMKAQGSKGTRMEGYRDARWVLMDFGDVILHIFDPADRDFYRLEQLWVRPETAAA